MSNRIEDDKRQGSTSAAYTAIVLVLLCLKVIGDIVIYILKLIYKTPKYCYRLILTVVHFLQDSVIKKISLPHRIKKKPIIYKKQYPTKVFWPHIPNLSLSIQLQLLKFKYFIFGGLVVVAIVIGYELRTFVYSLPNPSTLRTSDIAATTKIYDRHGKLLYQIYADQNRTPVKLSDIPKVMKEATIATEDKDFYTHQGYSLQGIMRAFLHNVNSENQEGGSTITQQLIRSAFLTPKKTFDRKIRELILAIWAEKIYTKDQILEMYFNQVPYGGTAYGIEAASQTYFGKHISDLDLAEASLLAGLPAAPSIYSPLGPYPELAKQRQKEVLTRMVRNRFISNDQKEKALQQPLSYTPHHEAIAAPHFVMYIKKLLEEQYGSRMVETGGLRVTTTLDYSIQEMAQQSVSKQIDGLANLLVSNGAAVVTNPKNGEILAMVGSRDYFDSTHDGNVNVAISLRQPGSSIKVVNYAAALQHGFTAATLIDDIPTTFGSNSDPYRPVNYDGRFHGKVPFRVALGSSYNIPAVKILSAIGVGTMIDEGKRMGISTWEDPSNYGLSLTLGGGEVTMLDMAKVYGTLANQGMFHDLTPFISITDYKGETLPLPQTQSESRALPESVAFIISNILADNFARMPAFGPNSALVIPHKTVSVKTGTSDNKRDNWTIGYTPDYVVTVWVGNNNGSPMHPLLTSGVTGAAPIWQEIITNLIKDMPDKPYPLPRSVVSISCNGKTEYFVDGTQPKNGCFWAVPVLSPSPVIQAYINVLQPTSPVTPQAQQNDSQPQNSQKRGKRTHVKN